MYSEPVTLTDRLVKQVQKNIVTHANITIYKRINLYQNAIQSYSAFLPNSDTPQFASTPNRATDRTKDIFDCRHEITKRADRLHISSRKGNKFCNLLTDCLNIT